MLFDCWKQHQLCNIKDVRMEFGDYTVSFVMSCSKNISEKLTIRPFSVSKSTDTLWQLGAISLDGETLE